MSELITEPKLDEDYFTPSELATRWKTTTGYLANRRYQSLGPEYIKLGAKVLYPIDGILAYERDHKRQGRTEPGEDEEATVRN